VELAVNCCTIASSSWPRGKECQRRRHETRDTGRDIRTQDMKLMQRCQRRTNNNNN